MTLTEDEKKVAYAWAEWVASDIAEALEDHSIERVDEDGFREILVMVLNDVAQSNAIRVSQHKK